MAYPEALKKTLAQQYENGKRVSVISAETGIPANSIYRWIKSYKLIYAENYSFTPKDFDSLHRRTEKLIHMIEILRLTKCVSSIPLKKRLAIMDEIYGSYPRYSVHEICEAMEVSRGTFYNHIFRKAETGKKDQRELLLMQKVQQIFTESGERYGADKIMKVLAASGLHVSKKRVLEIMQELGLESVRQGAKRISINKKEQSANKLKRNFSADRPNKIWVSDITHFSVHNKHFFICVIIDLYSRKVVAHRVSDHQSKQLVSSTLRIAIQNRKPPAGLIFHSDRGIQYTSKSFRSLLFENGMEQSLSSKGTPYDNAVAEAFFSTLKKEELYRTDYRSESEFKRGLNEYIEFYNKTRAHAYLKYKSPDEYEASFSAKNDSR